MGKSIWFSCLLLLGVTTTGVVLSYNGSLQSWLVADAKDSAETAGAALQKMQKIIADLPDASGQLAALSVLIEDNQRRNREQVASLQSGYTEAINILVELEARLRSLEGSVAANAAAGSEEVVAAAVDTGSRPTSISNAHMAQWLDQSIGLNERSLDAEVEVFDVAQQSVQNLPDIRLDKLQCGDGFCKATFSQLHGKTPEVEQLFGVPPFMNEGFTLIQPDGRVMLYFNQPGESMEELRQEVVASSR